ncbi:MAG: diguanylate cyclase [Pseudomonadota bacterium]
MVSVTPVNPAVRAVLQRLVVGVCLLVLACAALAAPTSPLRFKRLNNLATDDMSIMSMLQDRRGFVWIATLNGGLYRFDGYQSVRYVHDPLDKGSLPSDRTGPVYEDGDGRIWVATREGLARFNPEANNFTTYVPLPAPGSPRLVKNIISDGAKGMWLATWAGLQHFDPATGEFDQYVHEEGREDSLSGNNLDAMALDRHGGLWVGTWPAGIDYLPKGSRSFRHFRIDSPSAPNPLINIVHALHLDRQHRLWIGTGSGVYRWSEDMAWSQPVRIASPDTRINGFYTDRKGALWSGTMTAGLLRWSAGSDEVSVFAFRASDPYSVPTASIASLMQDRTGNLWVGTFNSGVSVANMGSSGFARVIPPSLDAENPLPNNTIQTIEGAPGGRIWMGGLNGFMLLDPVQGKVVRNYRANPARPGGLKSDTVYSFYQQPGGPLWVGTSAGLHRLDHPDGDFKVMHFGVKAADFINTIVPGANGKLWIGTGNSVVHFDPATGRYAVHDDTGDRDNRRLLKGASNILEDRLGRVWMGLESGTGMDMLDTRSGKFSHFRHDGDKHRRLSGDTVSALHLDADGRLWVATSKGLNEIVTAPDGKISVRLHDGGMGQPRIFAVRSEAGGALWLSTTSSLIRYDPATGTAAHYAAGDGLIDSYRVNASFGDSAGRLYFGGASGATVISPDQVAVESVPPSVAITDISVLNRSLALRPHPDGVVLEGTMSAPRALELSPGLPVFSIEFSALHYTDPALNRYAHQLVGFDRDWVMSDAAHRSATYTNLNPGTYLFKVKAANDRGLWNEEAALLSITILPRFWNTWWFRVAAVALAVIVLAIAYRMRVRSLTRSKIILEALVAARTGELEDSNAQLALSNAKLAALSMTDGLTGITNRRGFDAALADEWARAMRSGEPVALAMLDVDHFKMYNDRYGHQAGDQCLCEVAKAINGHARRAGDMAARYGGEEFALLSRLCYGPNALAVAQEVCAAVEALNIPHDGSPHGHVTVSIGVAVMVPDPASTPEMLVWRADQALYRVKQEGRNNALLAGAGDSSGSRQIAG